MTVTKIDSRLSSMDEELKHLNDAVFRGNGKPSLLARMEAMESRMATVSRLVWIIVGQLAAIIGAIVVWRIKGWG